MHEFPLDEAMGYNRRQQMDAVGHLANAGLDDRLYDDDFFANRPDQDNVQGNPVVEDGDDVDDQLDIHTVESGGAQRSEAQSEYQSARSHQSGEGQGLIREEPIDAPVQAPMPVQAGLIQPGPPAPVTQYSSEPSTTYSEAQWLPKRSNKVFGQYWKTFGERRKQAGFFGALFGAGMARANRAAALKAFGTAQLTRARELRAQQREADANRAPLRSALKTRLANAEPITGLSTFPREPGIAYDEAAATQAHRGFMNSRRDFHQADEDGADGMLVPPALRDRLTNAALEAQEAMKTSHDAYDASVGTRRLFRGAHRRGPDEKALAITRANINAGADMFALRGQQRRTPQRVRFADGAADTVGLPVNDANESYVNKPMPAGVRFFAAPIGSRTLEQDAAREMRREASTHAFRQLEPEEQQRRADAMAAEHGKTIAAYTESLGQTGHPDEISDEQAIENERFAWPIRAQMRRMRSDPVMQAAGQHEAVAMRRAMELGEEQAVGDDTFKDAYIRSTIGNEVLNDRQTARLHDMAKAESRRFRTQGLSADAQAALRQQLTLGGHQFDQAKPFTEQMPKLPRGYFDQYLDSGFRVAAHRGAAGAGAGGIIEEELE